MSIKKIAEIVGVSYSTVSRVLSNPEYKCSDENVKERILSAARELNYIPNEAAKNLKLSIKKEHTPYKITVLITRTESPGIDPFFREITQIVESEIHKNMCIISQIQYQPQLSGSDSDGFEEKMQSIGADGLIIIGKCSSFAIKSLKK